MNRISKIRNEDGWTIVQPKRPSPLPDAKASKKKIAANAAKKDNRFLKSLSVASDSDNKDENHNDSAADSNNNSNSHNSNNNNDNNDSDDVDVDHAGVVDSSKVIGDAKLAAENGIGVNNNNNNNNGRSYAAAVASHKPSRQPSSQSSRKPSIQPSIQPTIIPTVSPSMVIAAAGNENSDDDVNEKGIGVEAVKKYKKRKVAADDVVQKKAATSRSNVAVGADSFDNVAVNNNNNNNNNNKMSSKKSIKSIRQTLRGVASNKHVEVMDSEYDNSIGVNNNDIPTATANNNNNNNTSRTENINRSKGGVKPVSRDIDSDELDDDDVCSEVNARSNNHSNNNNNNISNNNNRDKSKQNRNSSNKNRELVPLMSPLDSDDMGGENSDNNFEYDWYHNEDNNSEDDNNTNNHDNDNGNNYNNNSDSESVKLSNIDVNEFVNHEDEHSISSNHNNNISFNSKVWSDAIQNAPFKAAYNETHKILKQLNQKEIDLGRRQEQLDFDLACLRSKMENFQQYCNELNSVEENSYSSSNNYLHQSHNNEDDSTQLVAVPGTNIKFNKKDAALIREYLKGTDSNEPQNKRIKLKKNATADELQILFTNTHQIKALVNLDHKSWSTLQRDVGVAQIMKAPVSLPSLINKDYHKEIGIKLYAANSKWFSNDQSRMEMWKEWPLEIFFQRILKVYPSDLIINNSNIEMVIEKLSFRCTDSKDFKCVDDLMREINKELDHFDISEENQKQMTKAIIKKIRNGGNAGSKIALQLEKDGIPNTMVALQLKWAKYQTELRNAFALQNEFRDKEEKRPSHENNKRKFENTTTKNSSSSSGTNTPSKKHKKVGNLDMTELRDANNVCRACGGPHDLPKCFNVKNQHPGINTDKNVNWADSTNGKAYKRMDQNSLNYKKLPDGTDYVSEYKKKDKSNDKKSNHNSKSKYLTLLNVVYDKNIESLKTSVETSYTIPCDIGMVSMSDDYVFNTFVELNVLIDTGSLQSNYISVKMAKKLRDARVSWLNKIKDSCHCNLANNHNNTNKCSECLYNKSNHSRNLLNSSINKNNKVIHKVCSGLDGVPCIDTHGEIEFDVRIPIYQSSKVQIMKNVKATILDTPYDLILGRPDIIRYDLLDVLASTFKQLKLEEVTGIRESVEARPYVSTATEQTKRSASPPVHTDLSIIYKKNELMDEILEDDGMSDLEKEIPGLDDKVNSNKTKIEPQYFGSPDLITKLKTLVNEFNDIFSEEVKPTPAELDPMIINVDTSQWQTKRNQLPPRTQTRAREYEIERQINKMISNNVIKPSQAAFYSQVHMTPKPNGKWRFCIDYRALNNCTESMGWPIPNVSKMLQRLGSKKAKYYATLDLTSGYHQAPLSKQSQNLSAFTTFMGVYEWLRVPMGLKAAPSHFQKQMADKVLCGLMYHICEVYLDDIITFGGSEEELLDRLRTVFLRFRKFGLTLNPEKCKFGMTEVEYVGHIINEQGLTFSKAKLGSVLEFPPPKDHEGVKSFVGLVNYFRDHIRNLSIIIKPLLNMIEGKYSKKKPIVWTPHLKQVFLDVKQLVADCPTLAFLDENLPIFLHTDACDYGIGGYLFQLGPNEHGVLVEKPIAFFSQSLTKEQLNWSVPEKEAFAIVKSLKKFEYLIRDVHFTLRTDHRNLTFINAEGSDKIKRWKMAIQHYNFDIEYLKGELNVVADAFSRLVANGRHVENTTLLARNDMTITGLPKKIWTLLGKVHNSLVGHNGVEATIGKLEARGDQPWPYMREQISYFIKHCPVCQKLEVRANKNVAQAFTTAVYEPMHTVSIDAIGAVTEDAHGYKYILTIIDNFTRFVELFPIKSANGPEAARCLLQFIGRYGAPKYFKTDQGSQFVNELMQQFVNLVGVTHQLTLAYSHEENGIVERANREVNRHIRAIVFDYKVVREWSVYLPLVQRIINSSIHSSIKMAPATLMFGNSISLDKRIILSPEKLASKQQMNVSEWAQKMQEMQKHYLEAAKIAQKATDEIHMIESPAGLTEFKIGSFVLVQYRVQPPTKYHMKWAGPMRVVKVVNSNTYSLQDLVTMKIVDYHITQMKPFLYNPNEVDPVEIARKEQQEFVVAAILEHRGNPHRRVDLEFLVKWEGYSEEHNSWEPWENVKDNIVLNQYLFTNKLKRHLTKEQKDEIETMN